MIIGNLKDIATIESDESSISITQEPKTYDVSLNEDQNMLDDYTMDHSNIWIKINNYGNSLITKYENNAR